MHWQILKLLYFPLFYSEYVQVQTFHLYYLLPMTLNSYPVTCSLHTSVSSSARCIVDKYTLRHLLRTLLTHSKPHFNVYCHQQHISKNNYPSHLL